MKLIFVTWGVISGLWKWITAASIGRLLKWSGYRVNLIKLDPYLNVDAGTMSPYRHGEVFVTDDGFETDLDLWHYERFVDTSMTRDNSVTTGKIYNTVLEKEREGKYLGDDIQVIPHVVNEVKEAIIKVASSYDVTIVEIGWTIGDIEGPHFTEAARQLRKDIGKENVLYVHVVPLLYLSYSKEFKTKPIQHSHKELTKLGIQADIFVCRSDYAIPQHVKDKISLFCDIDPDCIIENINCKSIYEVPLHFQQQKVEEIVQRKLWLEIVHSTIDQRSACVSKLLNATAKVRIGMVWKYAHIQDSYISVVESLHHAAAAHNVALEIEWIHAEDFEHEDKLSDIKSRIDGLIVPWGFGTRGMEGKIAAATFSMTQKIPYLWLCLGLQMAVIAFARHRCWLLDAHTLEAEKPTTHPVISLMPGQSETLSKGASMRLWSYDAILTPGSLTSSLYERFGLTTETDLGLLISERHRHRYEVNPEYVSLLEQHGLLIAWRNPQHNLVEFIELPEHPYFLATQAHPEFKSRLDRPHPLFYGLIQSCLRCVQ